MEEAMPFPRLSDVAVARETLVTIGREQRISADSHMTEPPDLWEKRLPPTLRDRAPRFPNRGDAGGNVRVGGWDPYPHSACIWPGATRFIAQDLGHLVPEARAKVLCGNAARLYNDGQLPPPADPPGDVKDLEAWNKVHWHE